MTALRMLVLVAVAALAACSPVAPEDATRLSPEAWFADVYAAQASCAGRADRASAFARVRFWTAPIVRHEGRDAFGLWVEPHDVYFQEDIPVNPWLVAHESLHHIMQNGTHGPEFAACDWGNYEPAPDGLTPAWMER